jgi:hypothetical protein
LARATPPIVLGDDGERVYSRNRRSFAEPSPDYSATVIHRSEKPRDAELYRLPGWNPTTFVSDDSDYVVVGYPGGNLLELKATIDETMLRFYRRTTLIKIVKLRELIDHIESLPRSPSHYVWGTYQGFIEPRRFALETSEGRRMTFDVTTGMVSSVESRKGVRLPPTRGSAR